MSNYSSLAASVLATLRERKPLVLCLTNNVVQQITANLLLSVGAAPVMLTRGDECADLLQACANALLVNVGTLSGTQAETMETAVRVAGECSIPWVLDPVAVGLLNFRTGVAHKLLEINPPALIRGNGSEIAALAGVTGALARGPESAQSSDAALEAARVLALQTGAAVLVTGETDYATDGKTTISCTNGHILMTRVTGVGCAMGALAAACTASAGSPLEAAAATAAILGVAGEQAAARCQAPGSFATALLDELFTLTPDSLASSARLS